MTATDDNIASIKEWQKKFEAIYHDKERKKKVAEQIKTCEDVIQSMEYTVDRKLIANIQKEFLIMDEQNWADTMANADQSLMLAYNIKMVELKVDLLQTILSESGILNKVKDIEEIIKLKEEINEFKELLKEQHKKNVERDSKLRENMEKLSKEFHVVC